MTDEGHRVLRLWVRPRTDAPLEERDHLAIETGKGVVGDHAHGRLRHVTIVFEDDFAAAARVLGRPVDPSARRANVLVSGGDGRRFVGRTIRLGGVTLEVKGLVAPCDAMDRAAQGLKDALAPDGRAGIWGRVVEGAVLRPGDVLAD